MAKAKTAWFCSSCGQQSSAWVGKCHACGSWNSFVEELLESSSASKTTIRKKGNIVPQTIQSVERKEEARMVTPDPELNRVLGGGIVPGALMLLGGEPGIGKSTLLLQVAMQMPGSKVLYVSGEESPTQIKLRAERIEGANEEVYLFPETDTHLIAEQMDELEPDWVVIDSIQTIQSPTLDSGPGSVGQIRQTATELMKLAKERNIPIFLIGHITKDGSIAGPKVLEHLVDTVLQFEGDRHYSYRLLRTMKNRFGSTSELGLYEMQGSGLRSVENPSELLLSTRDEPTAGIAIGILLEGSRPLLIEVQALVTPTAYGMPQRSCTGFDPRRLNMLLAVLEKRMGFRLGQMDVFLNMAGGIKVEDPALDLAVCAAIASSVRDTPLPELTVFCGEVGLSGEIRPVHRLEQRTNEASRLGFNQVFCGPGNTENLGKGELKLNQKNRLFEVLQSIL
jgi:DNA repair protein RadA/Sms